MVGEGTMIDTVKCFMVRSPPLDPKATRAKLLGRLLANGQCMASSGRVLLLSIINIINILGQLDIIKYY